MKMSPGLILAAGGLVVGVLVFKAHRALAAEGLDREKPTLLRTLMPPEPVYNFIAPTAKFKVGQIVAYSPSYTQYGVIATVKPQSDGTFTYDINVSAAIGSGGMARDIPENIISLVGAADLSKLNMTRANLGFGPLVQTAAMRGYLSGY